MMRIGDLFILAGALMAATAVRWRDSNLWRTYVGIDRDAKARPCRSTAYEEFAGWATFILAAIGAYLLRSGR
jgi:hypothetical protein